MPATSHLIRNLFLVGLISLGASISGCASFGDDDDDKPKVRIQGDADRQDEDLDDNAEINADD